MKIIDQFAINGIDRKKSSEALTWTREFAGEVLHFFNSFIPPRAFEILNDLRGTSRDRSVRISGSEKGHQKMRM